MKYIVALPDNTYFLWQMLVQINNFRKFGLEEDLIYVIGKNTLQASSQLKNILDGNVNCNFYVLNDTRKNVEYGSSLRPHILKKYFEMFPEMKKESFFYIDPDVILIKKIKFDDILKNNTWYLSNTKSYISSKYIKGKSEKLFEEMCDIVGISKELVEKNDKSAGGAQYLMKNISVEFWEKVEKDSENLYIHMIKTVNKYSPKNPIQAWTADMWALLWNAWLFGYETKIIKRLDFSWATDPIKKWDTNSIFHNAGAIKNNKLFVKTDYQISPFNKKINCSKNYCAYNYVKEIKDTEINFKNILF